MTRLQRLREERDLSREALGAAAGGISSATIARIERGQVKPFRSTVAALALALGVSTDDLKDDE